MHFSTPLVLFATIVTGAFHSVTVSAIPHGPYTPGKRAEPELPRLLALGDGRPFIIVPASPRALGPQIRTMILNSATARRRLYILQTNSITITIAASGGNFSSLYGNTRLSNILPHFMN
ncbi:hypothetical protein BC835DRAFT_1308139 [Cytidiella melzeri]|nr:hypothetical protein BC835DRAFT_1308139 [Cytidiella melzeri]